MRQWLPELLCGSLRKAVGTVEIFYLGGSAVNDTKYWLWLSMIFGTGNRRIWEAMRLFTCAEEAYMELSSGALNERLDEKESRNVKNTGIENAVQIIENCEKSGIDVIGYGDSEYPSQLRHILNPPAVLYCKGNISCLSGTRTVTSVGARHASDYGLKAADRICRELAKSGVIIVSGFAVGVDIASHLAAVSVNRPTACVMGCGVDVDYPRENFRYREAILANGGVFVSEFPPGTPPHSSNFPKRNRILAALGRAAVVFEAARKSGSLITAGLALEQGREVFCLPPANIFSESFSGNIMFLRDGAAPLYSASDILDCFKIGGALDGEIRSDTYTGINLFGVGELAPRKKRKEPDAEAPRPARKKSRGQESGAEEKVSAADKEKQQDSDPYLSLTPVQKQISELLGSCALHADIIAQKLELDAAELMTELTELEISGIIRQLPGKMFEIC